MTITLYYHPLSPPVRTVQLVAKALGIQLTLKHVDLLKGEHLTPKFLEINPQHTIPVLDDDGTVVCDSRAIIGYLADKYAKNDSLFPKDPKKRALVNQRLYFDAGTLYQRILEYFGPIMRYSEQPNQAKFDLVEEALALLNTFLEGKKWAAGDQKTIADYSLSVSVSSAQAMGFTLSKHPNVAKWVENCKINIAGYEEFNDEPAKKLAGFVFSKVAAKKEKV